jgi:hypothetical protein
MVGRRRDGIAVGPTGSKGGGTPGDLNAFTT